MNLNAKMRNSIESKKWVAIMGLVGIVFILFSLWSTVNTFYRITNQMNENLRIYGKGSYFAQENAQDAMDVVASQIESQQSISDLLDKVSKPQLVNQQAMGQRPSTVSVRNLTSKGAQQVSRASARNSQQQSRQQQSMMQGAPDAFGNFMNNAQPQQSGFSFGDPNNPSIIQNQTLDANTTAQLENEFNGLVQSGAVDGNTISFNDALQTFLSDTQHGLDSGTDFSSFVQNYLVPAVLGPQ
jgi:hypothetical protein